MGSLLGCRTRFLPPRPPRATTNPATGGLSTSMRLGAGHMVGAQGCAGWARTWATGGPSPLFGAARSSHDQVMKKCFAFAVLLVVAGVLAKLLSPKMQNVDWEKRFERMPENAPPKWMFRNIRAIRENTDRILELVDQDRSGSPEPASAAT